MTIPLNSLRIAVDFQSVQQPHKIRSPIELCSCSQIGNQWILGHIDWDPKEPSQEFRFL